jgi:heptosyltransferase-2
MLKEIRRIMRSAKASPRNRLLACFLHVVLWPILLLPRLFWPRGLRGRPIARILLIRIDGIGDLAMSSAIFPSLRRQFPNAQIDLLTSENARPIAELFVAEKWLDNIWRMPLLGRGLTAYWRLGAQFRRQRYDAAIDLRGDLRNVLLMWLARAPIRLGLSGSGLTYLLTQAVDIPPDRHQAEESAELIRRLGVENPDPWPRLPLQPQHLAQADQWLADNGIVRDRPVCAFHLGAFYDVKLWPAQRFAAVAKRLQQSVVAQVVVVGGPPEADLARTFAQAVELPVAIAVGKTSLVLTAAIIARCDAFIGTDSGPAHIAACVGCPVVVLFGPANPDKYCPLSPRVVVMRPHTPCDPACDKICARPATHCMLDHTVEAVAAAAETLIRESFAKRPDIGVI